jgi:hypothetical protein
MKVWDTNNRIIIHSIPKEGIVSLMNLYTLIFIEIWNPIYDAQTLTDNLDICYSTKFIISQFLHNEWKY